MQLVKTLGCMMVVVVLGLLEGLGRWKREMCACVSVYWKALGGAGLIVKDESLGHGR